MSGSIELSLPSGPAGARILSVGAYRPRRVVDNAEMCTYIDSTPEWIESRSGITQRRWAAEDETVPMMAAAASRVALERAGMSASDLDMILVATCSNLTPTPSSANRLQAALGAHSGALEVNSACAGFCHALGMANDLVRGGSVRHVLVVGAERLSDITAKGDRSSAFLFADGAGAVVVGPSENPGIGPTVYGSWGELGDTLVTSPSIRSIFDDATLGRPALTMAGQAVFRWSVYEMPKVAQAALDAAGVKADQLDAFIGHQANIRILEAMARAFGLPEHVVVADDIRTMGNTSAASIPLALDALLAQGRVRSGDLALLLGYGGGLSHAAQVVTIP